MLEGEDTPNPRDEECVVFCDFFVAGIRSPIDPILPEMFARFKVKMHHFSPNAIVQLSKFLGR